MNQAPLQKQTPGRRRQGGRNRTTPQQKTYASENDLPKYKPDHYASPTTPQKSASGGAAALRASSTNQKQRNKNNKKPRSKNGNNGNVSPDRKNRDHDSPSFHSKESAIPIFAGSTFHASPAPSALPIPSFLGTSYPDSPGLKVDSPGLKAASSPEQEPSPPTTESEEGSPSSAASIPRTDESPLEFFFRAHRAEKASSCRVRSANANGTTLGPFSPPDESPKECKTVPRTTASNLTRRPNYSQRTTSSGIPTNELDSNPGQPVGPAFSTPYHERIRAARSNQTSAQATPTAPQDQELSPSEALKRYLFTGQLGPPLTLKEQPPQQLPTPPQQENPQRPLNKEHPQQLPEPRLPRGMFPASVLTAHAGNRQPSAPPAQLTSGGGNHRSDQVLALEDGLRRMLKLNSSG
ncbi:hypothetical protein F4779DRAFT_299905 [Xylariaceae sp. FL0662B]|nr:hypothetical protein F4779DRAFT_299905 [Xylariaceae sp. FL0662B]